MNQIDLTNSYFPAEKAEPIWEKTVSGLLRETAANNPTGSALVEVTTLGELGRRWTYAELLADSERLATALASRFQPGERVVVWAPNIPHGVTAIAFD